MCAICTVGTVWEVTREDAAYGIWDGSALTWYICRVVNEIPWEDSR